MSSTEAAWVATLTVFVVALAGIVIWWLVESVMRAHKVRNALCICGHGRMSHDGYVDRFNCQLCRCRHYIENVPVKDWRF